MSKRKQKQERRRTRLQEAIGAALNRHCYGGPPLPWWDQLDPAGRARWAARALAKAAKIHCPIDPSTKAWLARLARLEAGR